MPNRAFDALTAPTEADQTPETNYLSDSFFREGTQAPPRAQMNRIRSGDLAARGIPSYLDATGRVTEVKDETGAPLTGLNTKTGIAYDRSGQPKQISYGEEGPPIISDPFAKLPSRIDPKTGSIEKYGPGGIYQYLGQDPETTQKVNQDAADKTMQKESALIGRKLTLDEHDIVEGAKNQKELHGQLVGDATHEGLVPSLADPKFHGANADTIHKAIDEHFDAQYGAPEANQKAGFFGGDLSPQAKTLRADLDAKKAAAHDTANQIFDLNDQLNELHQNVETGRQTERAQVETMLAHQQGQKGPLDEPQPGDNAEFGASVPQPKAGEQLYPPEEDWARMLGGKDAVDQMLGRVRNGQLPAPAAPAVMAATRDAQDAQAKAEQLKESDPTTAQKYKDFAARILNGLGSGVGELLRSPLATGILPGGKANPLNWGQMAVNAIEKHFTGTTVGEQAAEMGKALPESTSKLLDKRLDDTIASKAGNFIGGIAPYVATAIATKGTSVATPIMASLFFSSGYQRTLEDAKAKGADPGTAEAAATAIGAVNAVLALPLRTVGKAVEAFFGDSAPKVVQRAIQNAYEHGGPEGVGGLLGRLAEAIKAGGEGSAKLREEAVEGIRNVMAEIAKPAAQRIIDVGKTAASHAAVGAGVQTAENLVKKSYNPDQQTFEGVPEQAIGFGALGALSEGFRQVGLARKAKQALDIINKKPGGGEAGAPPPSGKPPQLPGGGEKPNEPTTQGRISPASKQQGVPEGPSAGQRPRPEKPVPQPDNANAAGAATAASAAAEERPGPGRPVLASLKQAETAYLEQGGHPDKLEAQQKLAALREQYPKSSDRLAAIKEHFAQPPAETPTVDVAAHEAATSPKNELAEPTQAQKEAGNYQKGHVTVGGLDISIENPAGSKRKSGYAPLQSHYGYIKGTVGADKDHVDIFVKQGTPTDWNGPVFVVNQHNKAGEFDEHKAVIGVNSPAEAKKEYLANYQKGWTGAKSLVGFKNPAAFKQWAETGAKGQPATLTQSEKATSAVKYQVQKERAAEVKAKDAFFQERGYEKVPIGGGYGRYEGEGASTQMKALSPEEVDKMWAERKDEPSHGDVSHVTKLVQGAMSMRKASLETVGHPVTVKATTGDTHTQLGIGVSIEGGKPQILVDHAKLAKETASFTDRERSRTIQRAIDEEIVHLAALKWEGQAPENRTKLEGWGKEEDEIGKFLEKSYSGWDKLSDRQKGHEKVRAVIQKRWTGRLTETARAVMRELMKFFRGIYDKLTAAQREIVDGVEGMLKGETKEAPIETKPPAVETKLTKLEARANELTTRFAGFVNVPATESAVIRTLLKSGTGKALDQAESKIAKLEEKYATTSGKQPSGKGAELSRVPPRENIRPHEAEIREKEGEQATGGGGAIERAPASEPEQKPGPGQPAISAKLDEKANKALDDAFEGLFAGIPTPKLPPGERVVMVQRPDGTTYPASFGDKVWPAYKERPETPMVGRIVRTEKGGNWSHGMLAKGEKIIEPPLSGAPPGPPESVAKKAVRFHGKVFTGESHEDAQNKLERAFPNARAEKGAITYGFTTTVGARFIDKKEADALYKARMQEAMRGEVLGAGKPMDQQAIPEDKLPKVIAAAQEMIRMGIDTPEKMASVLEEKFAGKARPFSQGMWDAIGIVRPQLRGTHDWPAIYGAAAQVEKVRTPAENVTLAVRNQLKLGQTVDRKALAKLAAGNGVEAKEADEAAEEAIVQVARGIAQSAEGQISPVDTFDKMVDLYERQPNLTAKTSTSKVAQAYSTPAPLAYAASRLADIAGGKSIYEPTAGNGMLLIEADPATQRILANEINDARRAALERQGFKVWGADATERIASEMNRGEKFDRAIANPPFGTILEEGESKVFPLWDGETKQIDFAIAGRTLDTLTDDGRAVLLLGGKNIKDPEERAKAYSRQDFWPKLYAKYKVVDHFTIDGDLYSKQGAGWPVDMIVIAGRGASPIQLPSVDGPRIIGSWDGLRNELTRTDAERIEAGRYSEARDREKLGGIIGAIKGIAGTGERTGEERHPEPVAPGNVGGRSVESPARPGGEPQPAEQRDITERSDEAPTEREGSLGARPGGAEPEQRGQLGFRVPYQPASTSKSFGIFIPTNMELPVRESLERLVARVGPIDQFVESKLNFKKSSLSAEQMDALALGIDAIDSHTAFVLGDQGGVGKGRVAAAMMAYSVQQGKLPIFVTKDPKLYAAMIEDLHDIGRDDIVPLMTNNDLSFADFEDKKWTQGNMTKVMQEIARTRKLPEGHNVLFTTYDQIQSDIPKGWGASKAERYSMKSKHQPPPDGPKMEALKRLAPGAIFIADESHLASGDSIRAWRLSPLLREAHGVYYSSATFAKRPDSMGIYSRTSLSHATQSMDDLVDAMKQGGVPLQQVVSATLASDGLYMRRERDFSHAVFRTHVNLDTQERDTHLADNYTQGLRTILGISNKMKNATKHLNKILRREGRQMHIENAPRVESTNFAAKLHNLVSQYLFAIKAESAVRRTIEGVTKGFTNTEGETVPHKVIITMQNTMEKPIEALERGGRPLNFNGMLLQYLDQQRTLRSGSGPNAQTITITDTPNPNFEGYSDQMLQHALIRPDPDDPEKAIVNEEAVAELFRRIMAGIFKQAEEEISALDLADMPVSPIDHIKQGLTAAGIKVGEITGRSIGVDEDRQIYRIKKPSKAAHLRTLSEFNNSDMSALLMNASGSTGISAHASEKFKSREPRAMLIIQPHLDINEFVQTLYRIDRTGQVAQPYYELLQTALPAELRPAAILGRKMGSLNANVTSNAENELSAGNRGVDIFNRYGDEVVYGYLRSDPGFVSMLDMPKIMDGEVLLPLEDALGQYEQDGQFAAAVSGQVAVMPTEEARIFWDKVQADYVALINYLNELGENELLADTIDMKAETLASKELTPAVTNAGRPSGFDKPSYLEKIKAEIGSAPLQAAEVVTMMEELGTQSFQISRDWHDRVEKWKAEQLARLSEKVVGWNDTKEANYAARWREQEEEVNASLGLIGSGLHIKSQKGLEGYGAITAVNLDDEHPLTPSKQIFTVHINTTKKVMKIPASQLASIAREAVGDFPSLYEGTAERSNTRYMVTGNLLSAYLAIRDNAPSAKIVQYTNDKGELRQGILMPSKFTPGALAKKRVVENASHMRQLLDAGRSLMNGDGSITIIKPAGEYVMRVPASKVMGGAYWRDSQLAGLMNQSNGEFVQRSNSIMMGKFSADKLPAVYQRLRDLDASLFYTEQESGETLAAGKPHKAPVSFYKDDVEPIAKSIGLGVKESLNLLRHLVAPTSGVHMEARDRAMTMLAERNQKAYETDRVLEGWRQAVDKMPRPEQIAFVDRMKLGESQPTPELQDLADVLRKIDTESWEAARDAYVALGFKQSDVPLAWLENHFRVLWKKIPGGPDKGEWIGKARRGLRGSMGQHKQHTLETMSDGLAEGGVPYSYNFVEMFKLAQADLWKLTSTLHAWNWAKDNGFVQFVKGPFPKAPDGMVALDDSIARVYFPAESGEGLISAGQYFVEEGFGRLLNNYLATDHLRAVKLGRGLLWIKNATTAMELSLSPFHAIFETLDAIGSNIGLGLQKLVNRGILGGSAKAAVEGLRDMVTAVGTPITHGLGSKSLGAQIRRAAANPTEFFKTAEGKAMLKDFPRAPEMINDLFQGGWKPTELEQDWRNKSVRTFLDSVGDIKAGASDNYIGAGLRAFPAANEMLMRPLFDYYIPNLKVAQFFVEYDEAIKQNERKLKGGILTRAALARQTWKFVEDRFGEMNYDNLFWNRTFKSAMQLMFRSVTWKLGSASAFAGAFGGQGKEFVDAFKEGRAPELHRNMAWLFGMCLLTAALGTIIQQALAHKKPGSLTDLVFPQIDPKDDKTRVSLPTYFKDLVHLIHSPVTYVTSSMAGWVGRFADLLRNRDYYGVQIHDNDDSVVKQATDIGKYLGQTLLPFSIRGYKNLSANDVGTLRKSLSLVGIQAAPRYIAQTPFEQGVSEYWKGQSSEEGIKPGQMERRLEKRSLVSQIEHGHAPNISQALAKGEIKPRDIKSIYQRAQMGPVASSILHMPLADAEKFYARANLKERTQLAAVMARKRANAAKANRQPFGGF